MKRFSIIFFIPVLLLASCKKWLNVSSTTEIVSEQQFKDVTGFRDAVVGVYVKMAKPELYSRDMTWLTVEFLSQQYAVVASASMLNVPLYNWNTAPLPTKRLNSWLGMYNAIANINQILKYQQENHSVFAGFPITDTLIKGEMLALRAYLHFDLMRLYGKSNLGGNPAKMNEMAIPYVTSFDKAPTAQRSYRETIDLMKKDIEEAIKLLEADPLSRLRPSTYWNAEASNNFISTTTSGTSAINRKMRMNYWAAKALYARILMWEGTAESKAKALPLALQVMGTSLSNSIGTGDGAYYSWVTSGGINATDKFQSDLSFVNEQLFTLQVENLFTIQTTGTTASNWFDASNPNATYDVLFLSDARMNSIFEQSNTALFATDWRKTRCLEAAGSTLTNWEIRKFYNKLDMSVSYSKRIPLIRVSEMFYIAAECYLEPGANHDKTKAVACLNKVRNQRNIPASLNLDAAALTDQEVRNEITKEYLKEFIGEGQLFFYYKRQGTRFIPNYANEMTDAQYQMPMPDEEVINGGGRSN
ncbi:MAG: RagB/SusD family nutrient uptake outer membrane protein [Chitinophagaceae bacterium]|nr:RagB/SusD family nutrient uptake outer membrane protein [Chitinophagaceae bacterium]